MSADLTDDQIKHEIKEVVKSEGYSITVETCRQVVATKLLDGPKDLDKSAKHFRDLVEAAMKDNLLITPSLKITLANKQVNAGVGKKGASSARSPRAARSPRKAGTKRKAPKEKEPAEDDGKPDPPKRPMSAYFLYANKHRNSLREAEPALKLTEVTSRLAEQYRALDKEGEEYKGLLQEYEDAKKRYAEEVEEYKKQYGSLPSGKSKTSRTTGETKPRSTRAPAKKRQRKNDMIDESSSASASSSSSASSTSATGSFSDSSSSGSGSDSDSSSSSSSS